MGKYPVVFFDLDHTLVDTRRQYDLGLAKTLETLYGDAVPQHARDRFQALFMKHHNDLWALYDKRTLTMVELRRQRFLLAWKDLGEEKSVQEADRFHEVYSALFDETLFVYEGTLEMVGKLADEHRLGIVTNGSPDLQLRKLHVTGLDKYFTSESLIISEHIGMAKPHPSVYAAALKMMGVRAGDSLMIGDNYRADYMGALACGLDAIWYVPDPTMTRVATERGHAQAVETPTVLLTRIEKLEQARLV
jgi:HAD superfamily hydrolase (TIGR01549 family)